MSELNEYRELYTLPEEWTDEQVAELIESGIEPKKTDRGNWNKDPNRTTIDKLSDGELRDAFNDQLVEFTKADYDELVAEARKRLDGPDWLIDKDVYSGFMFGTVPAVNENNVPYNDRYRDQKDAGSYTDDELDAWAKGDIEAGAKTTDAELAVELARRFNLKPASLGAGDVISTYIRSKEAPVESVKVKVEEPIKKVNIEGLSAMNLSFIETTLNGYVEQCAPTKPITMDEGIKCQKSLDILFRYVINLTDPKAFVGAMEYLREFVAKHRDGLFSDTYAYRFTGGLSDANNQRESHIQLIELFRVYTNPIKETRKQIHLPSMIRYFPVERQAIITEYFNSLN